MGQCNFCSLQSMKKAARKRGMVIKTLSGKWGMGGIEVFEVPITIKLSDARQWEQPSDALPNGDENWQKYHIAWLMEIPNNCYC